MADDLDFEIRQDKDGDVRVLFSMLKSHDEKDKLQFDNINDALKELKSYVKITVFGVLGSVGMAVVNLVLHHP